MTEDAEAKRKTERGKIIPDPSLKGTMKAIAGADHDEWNLRQADLVLTALPGKRDDEANTAILSGMGVAAPTSTARAKDCLAAPNSPAPEGRWWYYRLDWPTQRKCWYLVIQDAQPRHLIF